MTRISGWLTVDKNTNSGYNGDPYYAKESNCGDDQSKVIIRSALPGA